MDLSSLLGTALALFAVIGGALLEGLHPGDITVGTAALIVLGGTLAATLLAFPGQEIRNALFSIPDVFFKIDTDHRALIAEIVKIANISRKEGVLAIQHYQSSIEDLDFKKSVGYVLDGFDSASVEDILETELELKLEEDEAAARVWEAAGGYAPTIGILGAVLGLIHVMRSLDEPSKIGGGIAVAFVATIYGVAAANLVFLPWASKLKRKAAQKSIRRELVKIGVMGIQEGVNPAFLNEKLEVFLDQDLRESREKAN
jgi:chemotaxis protein MotA